MLPLLLLLLLPLASAEIQPPKQQRPRRPCYFVTPPAHLPACKPISWEETYEQATYVGIVEVAESVAPPGGQMTLGNLEFRAVRTYKGLDQAKCLWTRYEQPFVGQRYLITGRYHRLLDYCGAFALRNGTSPAGALLLEDVPIELLEALHDLSRQPQIEPINNTDADFFAAYNDTKAPTAVLPALPRPPCLFQTPAVDLPVCKPTSWLDTYEAADYVGIVEVSESIYQQQSGTWAIHINEEHSYKGPLVPWMLVSNDVELFKSQRYLVATQGANLNYCGAFAWMNGTQPIGSLLYEDAPIELLDMLHDLSRQPRPQPTPKKNDRQPAIDM